MKSVVVAAPCKVNLSLDINGRREDGYHLLSTVMQTVNLYDYLLISKGDYPGAFIECDREQLICDTTNTAYRAADLFFRNSGITNYSVKIEIIKNIPMQAGLGGGSSDAAAALVGLNQMFGTGYSINELCAMGVNVGADVPFCLKGGTVFCEGVGEIFTALSPLPDCFLLIAKPEQGILSSDSFARYDRREITDYSRSTDTERMIEAINAKDLQTIGELMFNELEEADFLEDIPRFREIMLQCGALGSTMTGSGSAVVGLFDDKRSARRAHRKLLNLADAVFITHPVPVGARAMDSQKY